jgi:hypothetical protein
MKLIIFLSIIVFGSFSQAKISPQLSCQVGETVFQIQWENTQKLLLIEDSESVGSQPQSFLREEELILTLGDEDSISFRNLSPEGSIYKEQIVEFYKYNQAWNQIYYAYTLKTDSLEYIYEYNFDVSKDCQSLVKGQTPQEVIGSQLLR